MMNEIKNLKKTLENEYPKMPDYIRQMVEQQVAAETGIEAEEYNDNPNRSKGNAGH